MAGRKAVTASTVVLTFAIIGIVLWKNYGTIKKGEILDPSRNKTAEEKQMNRAITQLGGEIADGQIITTNFGEYIYQNKQWLKTKELWSIFAQ